MEVDKIPLKQGFLLERDAKVVSQELYEYFVAKYGVKDDDAYPSIYRTRVKPSRFAVHKTAISELYSFVSAEEVRLLIKIPLKKDVDNLPDRVLIFDEDGKCDQIGGAGLPPPPPPPSGALLNAP